MNTEIATQAKVSDFVKEYNKKKEKLQTELDNFNSAADRLKSCCLIFGTFGDVSLNTGYVYLSQLEESLLKSSWLKAYNFLNIARRSTAKDKRQFELAMTNPAPFTLENVLETFKDYIINERLHILRGLAEVFSTLDPYYKSHEKMKIGVKGLPKRIIISFNTEQYYGYGYDRFSDIMNALAQVQGLPFINYDEINAVKKDGNVLENKHIINNEVYPARGVKLKYFNNGNCHIFFNHQTLIDINKCLSEYYGEVLPDCPEEKPSKKKQSTSLSKDLQFYATPIEVVQVVLRDAYFKNAKVLEPSCGEGAFMDYIKKQGGEVLGIECNAKRAEITRQKGHKVLTANFLEVPEKPEYDYVIMNPPFYGKHYIKHVEHALKFLKEDGILISILPSTARYDHKKLDGYNGYWHDLPCGSFSSSGTNINISVLTIRNRLR